MINETSANLQLVNILINTKKKPVSNELRDQIPIYSIWDYLLSLNF